MTGMAVLLLVRPIVRHRDRFAQSDERGDGWSAHGEHLDRAREHRGSNTGFLLGHHLGSGRPRQSDGSVVLSFGIWEGYQGFSWRNCIRDESHEDWNLPTTGDKHHRRPVRRAKFYRRRLLPSRHGQYV